MALPLSPFRNCFFLIYGVLFLSSVFALFYEINFIVIKENGTWNEGFFLGKIKALVGYGLGLFMMVNRWI